MLAQARAKGCYDRLVAAELGAFLNDEPAESADLCLAADVFIYCADLAPILAGIARVLRPGDGRPSRSSRRRRARRTLRCALARTDATPMRMLT